MNDPRRGCTAHNPFVEMTGGGRDYGCQYNVPRTEQPDRKGQKRFSLAESGREVATGLIMGGLASAAFYGAGRAVEAVKSSVRSVYEGGSTPKNVFPGNPDDLLPEIPRNKVTKHNGTISQTIQTSDSIRIRAEQHPLLPEEIYNPRHHGVHYHVEYKVDVVKSWNNKNNVKKWYPDSYVPGTGAGFLPGEKFPE